MVVASIAGILERCVTWLAECMRVFCSRNISLDHEPRSLAGHICVRQVHSPRCDQSKIIPAQISAPTRRLTALFVHVVYSAVSTNATRTYQCTKSCLVHEALPQSPAANPIRTCEIRTGMHKAECCRCTKPTCPDATGIPASGPTYSVHTYGPLESGVNR